MRVHLAGFVIFVSIILLSANLAAVLSGKWAFNSPDAKLINNGPDGIGQLVSSEGKVKVDFLGFGLINNSPTLKFRITNSNDRAAEYWSYEEGSAGIPVIEVNGNEMQDLHCGTGLNKYLLEPGKSLTDEVPIDRFLYYFKNEEGGFRIGYWFDTANGVSGIAWSQPILIMGLPQSHMTGIGHVWKDSQ